MLYKINYKTKYTTDYAIVEADTVEMIKVRIIEEIVHREWEQKHCNIENLERNWDFDLVNSDIKLSQQK